jgi:hypothetical protein
MLFHSHALHSGSLARSIKSQTRPRAATVSRQAARRWTSEQGLHRAIENFGLPPIIDARSPGRRGPQVGSDGVRLLAPPSVNLVEPSTITLRACLKSILR